VIRRPGEGEARLFILRIFAQLMIATAVMVLGYDALHALETGAISPITPGGLAVLIANQTGIGEGLTVEAILAPSETWPFTLAAGYGYLVMAPAFLILGVIGFIMAFLFRARR